MNDLEFEKIKTNNKMDFSSTNDYSLQLAVTDYENEETNKKQHTVYSLINFY